ncbi:hypothetical protein FPV67DRAFT_1491108, partial [Lyophyllum atratum]
TVLSHLGSAFSSLLSLHVRWQSMNAQDARPSALITIRRYCNVYHCCCCSSFDLLTAPTMMLAILDYVRRSLFADGIGMIANTWVPSLLYIYPVRQHF